MDSAVKPQNDHMVFYSYINHLFVVRQKRIFRAEISEKTPAVFFYENVRDFLWHKMVVIVLKSFKQLRTNKIPLRALWFNSQLKTSKKNYSRIQHLI